MSLPLLFKMRLCIAISINWAPNALLILLLEWSSFESLVGVYGVDHNKFRTCNQGSFCRRFTEWTDVMAQARAEEKPLPVSWAAVKDVPGLEHLTPDPFSFLLQNSNEEGPPTLKLNLKFARNGSVRFVVDETKPLHSRYQIPDGDVLVTQSDSMSSGLDAVAREQISINSGGGNGDSDSSWTKYTWKANTGATIDVKLVREPNFYIEVYTNSVLTTSVNKKSNFNFEIYRDPKNLAIGLNKTVDAAHHPNVEPNGLWVEHFGGHTDHKPRGPAALGIGIIINK